MKLVIILAFVAAGSLAHAEDFEGTWKVPDAQTQAPAQCKGGDLKECLRLAWTAEAGSRSPGDTEVKRLESARDWHTRACTIAKQKPCANADRVQAKLAAVQAMKTDGERTQFWCIDALDGAKHYTDASKTAPVVVVKACKGLLPEKFRKSLDALRRVDATMRGPMLFVAAQEAICPTLKTKPAACSRAQDPDKLSPAMLHGAIGMIVKAALSSDMTVRGDELVMWLLK